MATYSSHRLKMGKEEVDNFFLSHLGYFENLFTEMFIEYAAITLRNTIGR